MEAPKSAWSSVKLYIPTAVTGCADCPLGRRVEDLVDCMVNRRVYALDCSRPYPSWCHLPRAQGEE